VLLVLLIAPRARAAPCAIALAGSPTAEWRDAVTHAARTSPTDDCARIFVDVRSDHALLTFETTDGRSARRIVQHPGDLEATVTALRISGSPPLARAPQLAPEPPEPAQRAAAPSRSGRELHVPIALLAGLRGGADDFVSPLVNVSGTLVWGRWTLGALIAFDAMYFDLGGSPTKTDVSTLAAELTLGMRMPAGHGVLLVEARAGAAAYVWSQTTEVRAADDERQLIALDSDARDVEPRVGLAAGWLTTAEHAPRLRMDLAFEIVPDGLSRDSTVPAFLSAAEPEVSPPWAISAAVGLELDVF
jgi:hypothetical protein